MTKLEKIRQIVIEAVPEIVELKFGCEYIDHKGDIIIFVKTSGNHHFGLLKRSISNTLYSCIKSDAKIIGRPITLPDVLLAWKEKHGNKILGKGNWQRIVVLWNLKDDNLENQSKEMIDFIYNLLK